MRGRLRRHLYRARREPAGNATRRAGNSERGAPRSRSRDWDGVDFVLLELPDSAKVFQGKPSSNLTVGTGTGKGRNGDDRDGVAGGPAGAGFVGTWQERQAVLVGV